MQQSKKIIKMKKIVMLSTMLLIFIWISSFSVTMVSCGPAPTADSTQTNTNKDSIQSSQMMRESVFVVYKVAPDQDHPGFSKYSVSMKDATLVDADFTFCDYNGKYKCNDVLRLKLVEEVTTPKVVDTTKVVKPALPKVDTIVKTTNKNPK